MKRPAKTAAAALLCGALAVSAASCASEQTYPLTIDGEQIRAGIYIYEQQNAVSAALSKLSEEQPDLDTKASGFSFMNQTVEGKSFADWVNEKTVEYCRYYIAEKRLFASNGLTLTEDQNANVKSTVESFWDSDSYYAQYLYGTDTIGEYLESIGVGRQSFKELQEANEMRTALFDHLYGEGGELTATEEEINAALASDYAAVCYFEYLLDEGDAQSYVDRINAGESYETIYAEHGNAYQQQEYQKDLEEYEASLQTASEVTEETEDGETAAPEKPEEPVNVEVPAENSLVQIIKKDSTSPAEEVVTAAFEMSAGDVKVVTVAHDDHTDSYIVKKLDILSLTDKTADTKAAIRSELKEDEFEDMLNSTGSGYSLTEDSSKSLYKIETIIKSMGY